MDQVIADFDECVNSLSEQDLKAPRGFKGTTGMYWPEHNNYFLSLEGIGRMPEWP